MSVNIARSLGRIHPRTTALFVCDVQEKFRSGITNFSSVVQVAQRMVNACNILDIPVICTEQYPKGLGNTVSELDVSKAKVFEKTLFSMCVPEVTKLLEDTKSVLIVGLEAHVCVQQTTLDLLERGIDVHILADGVSSMRSDDRKLAFERMRQSGAFITSSQSALFMLTGDAKHPNFKEISKQEREARVESGLE